MNVLKNGDNHIDKSLKEDQKQYLYTQFEPQKANYVFPNFDQPDLKATWLLKAIVPQDWILISSEMEN